MSENINLVESEKILEKKLSEEVQRVLRGRAIKFSSQTDVGYPDRLCIVGDHCFWVEVKTTGERPTPMQEFRHKELRRLGQRVYVVDSTASLNEVIEKERRYGSVK